MFRRDTVHDIPKCERVQKIVQLIRKGDLSRRPAESLYSPNSWDFAQI